MTYEITVVSNCCGEELTTEIHKRGSVSISLVVDECSCVEKGREMENAAGYTLGHDDGWDEGYESGYENGMKEGGE
jgi:hypothetical protein